MWEGEAPSERVGVGVWEGVRLGLSEGVSLGVGVPLELSELVWLALAPTERAGVGVGEAVAERVGVPLLGEDAQAHLARGRSHHDRVPEFEAPDRGLHGAAWDSGERDHRHL